MKNKIQKLKESISKNKIRKIGDDYSDEYLV